MTQAHQSNGNLGDLDKVKERERRPTIMMNSSDCDDSSDSSESFFDVPPLRSRNLRSSQSPSPSSTQNQSVFKDSSDNTPPVRPRDTLCGQREKQAEKKSTICNDNTTPPQAREDTDHKQFGIPPYPYTVLGVSLDADPQAIRYLVQFADGSLSRTEGQIRAVFRFVGMAELQIDKEVVFDVLYDLPFDVVLGQDFLEDTQAFTSHEEAFLDVSTNRQHAGLNLVIWYPGRSKANNRNQSSQYIHGSIFTIR